MHADDRALRRQLVALLHDLDQVGDDELARLRIIEIERAFAAAPAISGRLRSRKSIAIAADVAVSSDVVEDQIHARRHRRNWKFGIDVEPADLAPRHGLLQTLQEGALDGAAQARGPILLLRFPEWAQQATNRQRTDRESGNSPDPADENFPTPRQGEMCHRELSIFHGCRRAQAQCHATERIVVQSEAIFRSQAISRFRRAWRDRLVGRYVAGGRTRGRTAGSRTTGCRDGAGN